VLGVFVEGHTDTELPWLKSMLCLSPCEIHWFDYTIRFTLQHFHSVAVILHMNNINLIVSFKIRFVIALLCQT